jgi:putative SOS response-associated peptidase YedK
MCGRFNSIASGADFAKSYGANFVFDEIESSFNVAPTSQVYVLWREPDGGESSRQLTVMRWGLVPSWSKDKTKAAGLINARCETLHEKPSFKNLLSKRRCIIPMQGFYEWSVIDSHGAKPIKQAHYISRSDGKTMTVAGLWTNWVDPQSKSDIDGTRAVLSTCTIITTEANEKLSGIHHRMPVILEPSAVDRWVGSDTIAPVDLLVPAQNEVLQHEITTRLQRTSNVHTPQFVDDQTGRLF